MTEKEYKEHIQYTHNAYCRIVIRHASIDAARMLFAKWKREISLEYLTEEKFVPLSTTDEYFQVPDYGETYPFSVRGQTILLDSCSLAVALAELPEQTQEEIFLYYFQHLTQKEIGEQSGWTRSTIGRHCHRKGQHGQLVSLLDDKPSAAVPLAGQKHGTCVALFSQYKQGRQLCKKGYERLHGRGGLPRMALSHRRTG